MEVTAHELDEARLEWQFETLQAEHRECCTGALLAIFKKGDAPIWLNVCAPVDSPNYRPWEPEE